MRILLCFLLLTPPLLAEVKQLPKVVMLERANLAFDTDDLLSDRTNEQFDAKEVDPKFKAAAEELFAESLNFLPLKYWPLQLTIVHESKALVRSPLERGSIPISVINSYQRPMESMIQLGMLELEPDLDGYKRTLAHEIGHMLVEWASRSAGSTPATSPRISFWHQSVYEGVGDYFETVLNGPSLGDTRWYVRDAFRFSKLEDALQTKGNTAAAAERGFRESGLIAHPLYLDWLEKVKAYIDSLSGDPYMAGSWLAGQLFKLGEQTSHDQVAGRIVQLAVEGRQFTSVEHFLKEVSSGLAE